MTYNSSEFIVDTLNSIVSQTYKNWEIIICDDCSTDDTCSIIDEWYALNQSSFLFKTLYSTYNQGVTNNLIKGINEAKGEWVKTMAGDDVFNINAIEEFVKEASISEHKFFFSRIELIGYKNDQSLLDYIELSSWLGRNIESVG